MIDSSDFISFGSVLLVCLLKKKLNDKKLLLRIILLSVYPINSYGKMSWFLASWSLEFVCTLNVKPLNWSSILVSFEALVELFAIKLGFSTFSILNIWLQWTVSV